MVLSFQHHRRIATGKPYRIAFRIDSGKQVGMGHFVRMSALADAFTTLYNADVVFFQTQDEPIDYSSYDVVVLDSYLLTSQYIAQLHNGLHTLVCYDDNALYTYDCDVILNANFHSCELTFTTAKPSPIMLLGGQYALLRSEFWEATPIDITHAPKNIFVCFGGTDARNQTPLVVDVLQTLPNIHLNVVLGKEAPHGNVASINVNSKVSIFRDPPSIAAIMQKSDIAVISAGSIVYETAALGLPSLTILQASNQDHCAHFLDENKLMQCVGSHDALDRVNLKKQVSDLLSNYDRRQYESKKLISFVNKQGALSAAEAIRKVWNESAQ